MRIGIDIRNIGKKRTGDEVVFFNLVKNLVLIDQKNEYKLFTDIKNREMLEKIEKDLGIENINHFQIISLPSKNKFTWNFWTLPKNLRKNPVDVYLTQYIIPFFVPKKIKIITIIHDVSFMAYKQFIKKSDLFFLSLLVPLALRRADKIVAVSKFTRLEINKYYGTDIEKIEWIHNAVDADFLEKVGGLTASDMEGIRKKYRLPEKFILYLGTLQPRKNIPTLIEAYAASKVKPWKLVIAGGKGHNYDRMIDEVVKKHTLKGDIIFPGFIDEKDKAAVLKAASIFCFPSFYEGFGIPILEAFASGTPTVVSGILPHKEISGEAALYFDPSSIEELSQKLSTLMKDENLRKDLATKGIEQVKNFSWEKTAGRMLEIFERTK